MRGFDTVAAVINPSRRSASQFVDFLRDAGIE
jgi:hypothetical protein